MTAISIEQYERTEAEQAALLPNRALEAFADYGRYSGYPIRVSKTAELAKYIDAGFEFSFEGFFGEILEGITPQEFDSMQWVLGRLCDFTEETFGNLMVARAPLLQALNVYRHINFLFPDRKPRVFEFGPGAGYLGAFLYLHGSPYVSTDISQAFYILQNKFWSSIAKGSFREGLLLPDSPLNEVIPGSISHLPWWSYASLMEKTGCVPPFDIVTCSHSLCTMNQMLLRYLIKMSRMMLAGGAPGARAFIFEGWGDNASNQAREEVASLFYQFGYVPVLNDRKITVFALRDDTDPVLSSERSASLVEPYSLDGDARTSAVLKGRKEQAENRRVSIWQLNVLYTLLLQNELHENPDEVFLRFIGEA